MIHSSIEQQPNGSPAMMRLRGFLRGVDRWFGRRLVLLVKAYQWTLSPWLGRQCRFYPTCSHYGVEALTSHGAMRGSWLTLRRLLRCQPFSIGGFDPVPGTDEPTECTANCSVKG